MQLQSGPDHHPIYDEICHVIYRCKEKAEKEGVQLSDVIGVHKTTIWRWEQKLIKRQPQIEPIVRLLQYDSGIKDLNELLRHFSGLEITCKYINDKYRPLVKNDKVVTTFDKNEVQSISTFGISL